MTLQAALQTALADEAWRRQEFPVAGDTAYLAHAAVCPLPACVVDALTRYLQAVGKGGQFEHLHAAAEAGARRGAAALIGATPEEIAFAPSTSAGLSMIAAGLPWRAGDNVVIAEGDFPSNVHPWQRLRKLGVAVRQITADGGEITLEHVCAQLDANTRLVALSSVHYVSGARLDLAAIGRHLQERGVLFCVDAIQSLGVLPTPCEHVDFMVADAHKWLLGPQGIAVMFVRRSRWSLLEPLLVGWKSASAPKDFVPRELELAQTARRYEPGSLNALGLIGLHAALELLQRHGGAAIAERVVGLRRKLAAALSAKGYEVFEPAAASGIVSFRRDATDMQVLARALDRERIIVSLRHDARGRECVRVAPHFYNTDAELERMLAMV